MTEEELKEQDVRLNKLCFDYHEREKRIAELEEEVTRLRNENLDIINKYTRFAETDRRTIAELEAQIEKMKCCGNCAKYNSGYGENPCKISASGICGEWETSIGKF